MIWQPLLVPGLEREQLPPQALADLVLVRTGLFGPSYFWLFFGLSSDLAVFGGRFLTWAGGDLYSDNGLKKRLESLLEGESCQLSQADRCIL